jgi:putative transposase
MKRLTRLPMLFTDTPVYFITACTEKRRHLLANDETHEVFRQFCTTARDRGALVGRYVLVPDHLHLFVCIPPGEMDLSMWMKSLKNTLSKHWRSLGIAAPHWQKGFFDHLIRSSGVTWRKMEIRSGKSDPSRPRFESRRLALRGKHPARFVAVAAVYDRRSLLRAR